MYRIYTDDPDDVMPPPESNLSLTATEKTILKKWIEQGATWKEHWSLLPPVSPDVPAVDWGNNEVDAFIFQKMQEKGLSPSPTTSKEKLLRRISFDLTGLPSTLAELDEFLSDDSPLALVLQNY